jgi:hypothetical protein
MHAQTFMGDILSDLPAVSNFTVAEAAAYQSKPQTPLQLWLRRDPPAWQASREERAARADAAMAETHAHLAEAQRLLTLLPCAAEMVRLVIEMGNYHCEISPP